MSNRWVEHVKLVAHQRKITYGAALKIASKSYSARDSTGNQSYGGMFWGKAAPKKETYAMKEEFCRIGDCNLRWSVGKTGIIIEGPQSAVLVAGLCTNHDGRVVHTVAKGNKIVFPAVYNSTSEAIQRGAVPMAQLQLKLKRPYEGQTYLALHYQLTPSTYKQVGCEYGGEELIEWD